MQLDKFTFLLKRKANNILQTFVFTVLFLVAYNYADQKSV